jgi:membrane fusion protein (multidrug efflux system)
VLLALSSLEVELRMETRVVPPKTNTLSMGMSIRLGVLLLAAAIFAFVITHWDTWIGARERQTTDDAYLRGDITPVSAKVDGYVRRVAIRDFQEVKAGDLLVQIDDAEYQALVAQAEADVLAADATIDNLQSRKLLQQANIAEAESAIAVTQADVQRTKLEEKRQSALLATSYGTPQKVEQATADRRRFEATLASNRAALDGQRRQMGVLDTEEAQLRADARAKRAMLDLARINLGYTRILAPADGMVSERAVRAGQYVHIGTQVISVVPLRNVWIIANFKETQLTRVAIGQKAEVTVDTFPGTAVAGHVDSIAPASGSQFSLLPPDNATGNFTKVVQRIPVKIVIDSTGQLIGKLRPGMSAVATIITDTKPAKP